MHHGSVSCEISDAAMEKGAEYVGSSLTEALKQANEESKKTMGEKMTEMYQTMDPAMLAGLPGM